MEDRRCYIPKRYILTILGFMGVFNTYSMRISLSVTIVAMVKNTKQVSTNFTADVECPELLSNTKDVGSQKFIGTQYDWDGQQQGLILGAFYYGYAIIQLLGGFLFERVGAKWIFGCAVLNTAVFTLLTPFVTNWGVTAFVIVRIIEGLGEGLVFPAINLMISHWSPIMERSRLSTIIFMGQQMGSMISMSIAGWLSSTDLLGGWPSVFYLFGTVSCMWFLSWAILVHETPEVHPTISAKELLHIQANKGETSQQKPKTPWKSIFLSLPMWSVIIAQAGQDFGFLIALTEMPTYLSSIHHFNIKNNGLLSALPFLLQAISACIASCIADKLRRSNILSITNIRKVLNTIGVMAPALCLLIVTVSGCRPYLIVFLFSLGMAINGFAYSGHNVIHIDMSPALAGTLYAISNTAASCGGFIGPAIVGAFTDKEATIENWNCVFYITAGAYAISGVFFIAFASAEIQPWRTVKEDSKTQNK